MYASAFLAAGLLAEFAFGSSARDCRSTGVAARQNGDIVVSTGADLFLFGQKFELENQMSRQVKPVQYDTDPYASFALDSDGTLYVAGHFRYRPDPRATTAWHPAIPFFLDMAADPRSGRVYLVGHLRDAVSIGTIDRVGEFHRLREDPLPSVAGTDVSSIASDPFGGFCLAWDRNVSDDFAHTINEHHVACRRNGHETFAYRFRGDGEPGDSVLSDLTVLSNGDIALTGLPTDVCILHRLRQNQAKTRCSRLDVRQGGSSRITTDGTSFIVENTHARTVTAYDRRSLVRTWILTGVGDASAPPVSLAVADGILYVGEQPSVLPFARPDLAPHDILRFRLRGNRQPEPMPNISGTDLGFVASHNITPIGDDRLVVGQTVIASASGVARAIQKEGSNRTLGSEALLAFAPNGRSFANGGDGSLVEYPAHPLMADRPILSIDDRVLSGSPYAGIAANDMGFVFRSNPWTQSIVVMWRGTDAERPFIYTISGPHTQLASPTGVALDATGNLYVANRDGDDVLVFVPGARGDVAPIKVIGNQMSLHRPTGVSIAADGSILVVDNSAEISAIGPPFNSKLKRFSTTGATLASIDVPSSCFSETP